MARIAMLIRALDQGGAQRQLVNLALGLKARGHDVHVVVFYSGGAMQTELASGGVKVHAISKRGRWDIVGFLSRLTRCLRELRADAIYSFLDVANILAFLCARFVGEPRLIWSVRAANMDLRRYDSLSRTVSWIEQKLSRYADAVIANSNAGAEWALRRGFPRHLVQVIENGIDIDRFKPNPIARQRVRAQWGVGNDELLLGVVARLDPMKDHPTFLRAFARVHIEYPGARAVCVGDGPASYRAQLVALSQELEIEHCLIWAGPRDDVDAIYNALDILVSSSSFGEGFSNAIGEAMASGVPCVVTEVGDSMRIVGDLGEVAPPGNAHALAQAIAKLHTRISRAPGFREPLRNRIQSQFSLQSMVTRSEAIILARH